jgi:hypothetical protein
VVHRFYKFCCPLRNDNAFDCNGGLCLVATVAGRRCSVASESFESLGTLSFLAVGFDRFDKSCVGLVSIGRGARTLTRASVPAYHAGVRNIEVHLPMRKAHTPARLLRLFTLQILGRSR